MRYLKLVFSFLKLYIVITAKHKMLLCKFLPNTKYCVSKADICFARKLHFFVIVNYFVKGDARW